MPLALSFLSLSVSAPYLTHSFYVFPSPCGKGDAYWGAVSDSRNLKGEAQIEEAENWFYSKLKEREWIIRNTRPRFFCNVTYFRCCGPLPTHTYLPLSEPWGQLLVQHMEFLCEKTKSGCLPWHPPRLPDSGKKWEQNVSHGHDAWKNST